MSKFQVKATYEGKTKFVEFERKESTSHANLESKLKAALSISALAKIDLLFKPDSGMNQVLRQDVHVENALREASTQNARYLNISITPAKAGGEPVSYSPAPVVSKPAMSYSPSPSVASPAKPSLSPSVNLSVASPVKFCSSCGSKAGAGKFCAQCGTPLESISNEAPANLSPSASPSTAAGRLSAAERKSRRSSAPFPKASSASVCAACGLAVGFDAVSALEKTWHKECFNCSSCKISLINKGFKREGEQALCPDCYADFHGMKCFSCKKTIVSTYLEVQGNNYHAECFVCSRCRSPFQGGYAKSPTGQFLCRSCLDS